MKAKRYAALLLALLMLCFAAPALAASYHTEIRVLLSVGKGSSLDITPVGEYYLLEDPSLALGNDKLTVTAVGSQPSITAGGKTVTAPSLTLMSRDYGGTSAYIRLRNSEHGTCTYLGNMTFTVQGGRIRAVNTLPMEQYLYGVVPNEMSNSFPVDALKAQAVCARSYAMAKCSRYATRSYDLGDTSNDQVYHGYASKNLRAIAAVDATAGQVLTYEGDIIEAFYSSSNGGQTERTGNVWSEDHPYYINADDPFDLANPSSMEYLAFIPRVFEEATVSAMSREVYAALLRGACEAAGEEVTLLTTVAVSPKESKYEEPSRSFTVADVTLTVEKADGSTGQLTVPLVLGDMFFGTAANTLGALGARTYTLRLRGAEPAKASIGGEEYAGWNLTMRRWGHGVGLSQRGAQQRAREGQPYEEILGFYYVNTAVCTVGTYASAPEVKSDKYRVKKWGVSGVEPGTKPADFLKRVECEAELSVVTSRGELKLESELTTGNFLRLSYGESNDARFFDLPIVIYGDLDSEGGLTAADAEALADHLAHKRTFTGPYLEAADVNHDGDVNAKDLLLLIRAIRGDETIKQRGE